MLNSNHRDSVERWSKLKFYIFKNAKKSQKFEFEFADKFLQIFHGEIKKSSRMCFGRREIRRIFLGGRFEIKMDFSTVAQRILFQDITRNLTVTSI